MKIKYLLIIYTLFIAILIGWNVKLVYGERPDTADMASLNKSYQQILTALSDGQSRELVEEDFSCQIYLKTDANYQTQVMRAVSDGKLLLDYENGNQLLGKIVFSGQEENFDSLRQALGNQMIWISIVLLLLGYLLIGMIYWFYIGPFRRLQSFASNIAKGNLDAPLFIGKENYFGAFTESFDLMREELKTAREREYQANISKKELVAELSHDMKTPVATIKATCEVLKLKAQKNGNEAERLDILEKADIIEQKSDMIDQLINNMFHATLEELESLRVEPAEEASTCMLQMFEELHYYKNIRLENSLPECLLYLDRLRLKQVIDNIVNNSYKYAGTEIAVSFREQTEGIIVEIRDYGPGVPEEELPLITEKYFRGDNGKGKSGAGLGLFLAKYFMEHMRGELECYNDGGFVVNLFLRKV